MTYALSLLTFVNKQFWSAVFSVVWCAISKSKVQTSYRNLEISRTLELVYQPTQGITTEWQHTVSGLIGKLAQDAEDKQSFKLLHLRRKICLSKNEQAVSPVSSNTMQSSWLWQSRLHYKHFGSSLWTVSDLVPWTGSSLALGMQLYS